MAVKQVMKQYLSPLVPLYSKFYNGFLPFLLRICAQRNYYRAAAGIFWLTIRKIPSTRRKDPGRPLYHIFFLRKATFEDDMFAVFGHQPDVQLYAITRRRIKDMAYAFLPTHLTDLEYRSRSVEDEKRKQAYRAFMVRMWSVLQKFIRCDAVLTGNFSYHAEQEFAGALEELGTPFIALHKESLRPPKLSEFYAEHYRTKRAPFCGRKILAYNELEKQAQIRGEIVPAERIVVTGSPRFDTLHELRKQSASQHGSPKHRPRILFFFFTQRPLTFLQHTEHHQWAETIQWNDLLRDTFLGVLQAARQSQEIEVIIKTKSEKIHTDVLQSLLDSVQEIPPNVNIIESGSPLHLIVESDVVCGFNTTAILDALALDKPAVVPRFAEAVQPEFQPFIVNYGAAVEYADSPEELVTTLRMIAEERHPVRPELSAETAAILEQWVGNGDGRAAERVRQAVLAEICAQG